MRFLTYIRTPSVSIRLFLLLGTILVLLTSGAFGLSAPFFLLSFTTEMAVLIAYLRLIRQIRIIWAELCLHAVIIMIIGISMGMLLPGDLVGKKLSDFDAIAPAFIIFCLFAIWIIGVIAQITSAWKNREKPVIHGFEVIVNPPAKPVEVVKAPHE